MTGAVDGRAGEPAKNANAFADDVEEAGELEAEGTALMAAEEEEEEENGAGWGRGHRRGHGCKWHSMDRVRSQARGSMQREI